MPKLNYKIVGRRPLGEISVAQDGSRKVAMEAVDVEWTHDDGPVKDTALLPTSHPPILPDDPPVTYAEKHVGSRDKVLDQVNVPAGTPDHIVAMMLEEKRAALAKNLRVEP